MALSSKLAFTFNGVLSSTHHIYCDRRRINRILPAQDVFTRKITGRDGAIDLGIGGHAPFILEVPVIAELKGRTIRADADTIAAWLYSVDGAYSELRFGWNAGRYYMAKAVSGIDFPLIMNDVAVGSIFFYVNPPFPYIDQTALLLMSETGVTMADTRAMVPAAFQQQWAALDSAHLTMTFDITSVREFFPSFWLAGYLISGLYATCDGVRVLDVSKDYGYDVLFFDGDTGKSTLMSDGTDGFAYMNTNIKWRSGSNIITFTMPATALSDWKLWCWMPILKSGYAINEG
jgi:hypothetical protein